MDSRERILTKAQQTGWRVRSFSRSMRFDREGHRVSVWFDSMNRVRSAHYGDGVNVQTDRLHGVNEVMDTLRMFGEVR